MNTSKILAAVLGLAGAVVAPTLAQAQAQGGSGFPVTPQQKQTAERVAQAGVPLSELAPNAPDSYTVKKGDTLWGISTLFLKSPWRWPELWGMNRDQIRNPHLIYPGQILVLDKSNGRATLKLGKAVGDGATGGDVRLSPRVRINALDDPIAAVPVKFLEAFFNEAVIFESADALAAAPRLVATQEGRVMASRGELVYARGDFANRASFRVFRQPRELKDPADGSVLGYEAAYVGTADMTRAPDEAQSPPVPATLKLASVRQEAMVGDRLAPEAARELDPAPPHAPLQPLGGQIVSLYGEALTGGQNQIVALNRGSQQGVERGHVLALLRDGPVVRDTTSEGRAEAIKLPDERHGLLYVFRVFDRMSYALILTVRTPVKPGDRFAQP